MNRQNRTIGRRSIFGRVMALFLAFLLTFNPCMVYALPQIDQVVSGKVDVLASEKTVLNINASDNSIVNYKSFNIAEEESVFLNLPSSVSKMLNRVTGGSLSEIYGRLESNGMIFLINASGIVVGPTGVINTGSLVLSTRDIQDSDFLKKNYVFDKKNGKKNSNDLQLLNEGEITIKEGGFGVLIAGAVENAGRIVVPVGQAVLAGGDAVRLGMSGDGLISVTIDKATASAIVDQYGNPIINQVANTWDIEADGGMVILKAESMPGIFEKAINLDGFASAQQLKNVNGVVKLVSSGKIEVNGFVDAPTLEISGSAVAAPNSISIDKDFLNISKLVVSPKELVARVVPDLGLTAGSVPAGATVNETEALCRVEEKSLITQDYYSDYKVSATADGTQNDRISMFGQTVLKDVITDSVVVENGTTVRNVTIFSKGAEVTQNLYQQKIVAEAKNNQERTVNEEKSVMKYAAASVDYKIDRLNSSNNLVRTAEYEQDITQMNSTDHKVVYTGSGSEEMKKIKSLMLMEESSKRVITPSVGESAVITMNNKQSVADVKKVTTHTRYTKDGVEVSTMTLSRQTQGQDLTNAQGTIAAPDAISRNVKSQQDIKDLTKVVSLFSKTADGNTLITTDIKAARDINGNSLVTSKNNKVTTSAAVKNTAHYDADIQATTKTNVAIASLVRPLKDMGKSNAAVTPAVPAKKVAPLVLSQTTIKEQRIIEKTALAQNVSDWIEVASRSSSYNLERLNNGNRQTWENSDSWSLNAKTVADASAVYKEKGIQQVQYYNKPWNVTSASQQVVKPQSSYVTTWNKATNNSSSATAQSQYSAKSKSKAESLSTWNPNKSDYRYDYVSDNTWVGSDKYSSHDESLATSQNSVYRVLNSNLLNADLKKSDLFKSKDVASLVATKPSNTYSQETKWIADYKWESSVKAANHYDVRIDQSYWKDADGKNKQSYKRSDNSSTVRESNTSMKYDSSYVLKYNGKVSYNGVYSVWSQTNKVLKGSASWQVTVLK